MTSANIRALQLSENDETKFINYFSGVNERGISYHILPWHSVAVLNCLEDGSLVDLNNSGQFSEKGSRFKPWLLMKLKLFYIENEIYPIFVCPICPQIKGVLDLFPEQNPTDLKTEKLWLNW